MCMAGLSRQWIGGAKTACQRRGNLLGSSCEAIACLAIEHVSAESQAWAEGRAVLILRNTHSSSACVARNLGAFHSGTTEVCTFAAWHTSATLLLKACLIHSRDNLVDDSTSDIAAEGCDVWNSTGNAQTAIHSAWLVPVSQVACQR